MKKPEEHSIQLMAAFTLQAFFVPSLFLPYACILYRRPPPFPIDNLTSDLCLGLSLLPVIAAIRRGQFIHKIIASVLAVPPLVYISLSIANKLPACMALLSEP